MNKLKKFAPWSVAIVMAMTLAGCSGALSSTTADEPSDSIQTEASESNERDEQVPTGTPYGRVVQANGGETELSVSEIKDFADERERTRYRVTATITAPDFTEYESKMYSVDNPGPSEYITVEYPNHEDKPDISSTEELTFYVEPRGVLFDDEPFCYGSVRQPGEGYSVVDASFEDIMSICGNLDTASIVTSGHISLDYTWPDHLNQYWLYEDAEAMINEDETRRIRVAIDPKVDIEEGSEVSLRLSNVQEIEGEDNYGGARVEVI